MILTTTATLVVLLSWMPDIGSIPHPSRREARVEIAVDARVSARSHGLPPARSGSASADHGIVQEAARGEESLGEQADEDQKVAGQLVLLVAVLLVALLLFRRSEQTRRGSAD